MTSKRIFLAHAKSDGEEALAAAVRAVRGAIEAARPGAPVEVTLGRDDWARRFKACGSWNVWCETVASGVHFLTREPNYHGIVVTSGNGRVGAATKRIVEIALANGKPVYRLDGASLVKVSGCRVLDPDDWKGGTLVL